MSADVTTTLEAIKQRQKAAQSSTGTKALLIQTFTTDLPWLIEQVERLEQQVATLTAENERLSRLLED
jgi:hypothetical protein